LRSGSPALAPPRGPITDVFYVDSGHSQTFNSGTSWIPDGDRWWPLPEIPAAPRGPAIDISNFGGDRCRTCRQHPPEGPPSTSPTSVVAAARPAASTSQGAHRRCLQLRWWPLLDLPPAPPGGPPSMFSTLVVAAVGPAASTPQGACHRRLQLRWWPLSDLPLAPPRGPAIDVSNFGGGRYRTCRQQLPGGQPLTSPTFGPLAPAPHRGPPSTFLSVDGGRSRTSSFGTSRVPAVDYRVKS
jgi:hypothetical protein